MILDAVQFVRDVTAADPRPWLVVGKGPTAARVGEVALHKYHVLTLNHACLIARPTLAHFVDLEAFNDCGDALAQAETPTCLPWHPHVGHKPSEKALYRHACLFGRDGRSVPLAWLMAKGKLLSYNASTWSRLDGRSPRLGAVRLRYFSAVGAFNLLGEAGVAVVHSVGVDGGKAYATGFDTGRLLANGQASFDIQFPEIERAVRRANITHVRLFAPQSTTNA